MPEQEQEHAALADRLAALRDDDATGDETGRDSRDSAAQKDRVKALADQLFRVPQRQAEEQQRQSPRERPVEGYDRERRAWLKTFSLGTGPTGADLHTLSLHDAAGHQVTAGLSAAAARAAQDAGYRPAAAPELIDVRRNGEKTDLTYAVPTDPRD